MKKSILMKHCVQLLTFKFAHPRAGSNEQVINGGENEMIQVYCCCFHDDSSFNQQIIGYNEQWIQVILFYSLRMFWRVSMNYLDATCSSCIYSNTFNQSMHHLGSLACHDWPIRVEYLGANFSKKARPRFLPPSHLKDSFHHLTKCVIDGSSLDWSSLWL